MIISIEEIRLLISSNRNAEAIEALSVLLDSEPENSEAFYLRGKVYWRMNQRSKAVSDYCRAVAIDPESKARHALEAARDVEDFFNTDLMNP